METDLPGEAVSHSKESGSLISGDTLAHLTYHPPSEIGTALQGGVSNNQDFVHNTNTANGPGNGTAAPNGTGTDNSEVIVDGVDSRRRSPVRQRKPVVRFGAGMMALEEYDTPKTLAEAYGIPDWSSSSRLRRNKSILWSDIKHGCPK